MKNFFLLVFINFFIICFAQTREIDSVNKVLRNIKHDTTKASAYVFLSEQYAAFKIDSVKPMCLKAIQIVEKNIVNASTSERKSYMNSLAVAYNNLAFYYQRKGDLSKTLISYQKSLELQQELGNELMVAGVYNNIGYIYSIKGENTKALDFYYKSLQIQEKISDDNGAALTLNNIGSINFSLGEYDKALENFKKSLRIQEKIGNKAQEALFLNNIGFVYQTKGDTLLAIDYYNKSLKIKQDLKDINGIAIAYNNFGTFYNKLKNYTKAFYYYNECLKLQKELGDSSGIPNTLNNIGNIYIQEKDFNKALEYCKQSLAISERIGSPNFIYQAAYTLFYIYESTGKFKDALEMYKKASVMKDSIDSQDARKSMYKKELDYDYSKKAFADSLKTEEDKKITEVKLQQEKSQRYVLYGGILILLCVAVFIFNRLQITRKQNIIIENQKLEVELKNEEITHQKEIVEEKQKEIIDSINYAKRIQTAVLTGKDVWGKVSKEHFILFKPKDIVSGDFHWAYNTPNNRSVFALADCTGHGVPGGFMSMLGNSFLNEIVVENKIFKADEILNKLRAKIIAALEQEGRAEQKDGMDITLCVWNKIDNTLEFAGANNPLWILSGENFTEYKADKMPIGTYIDNAAPFSSQLIQLNKGDIIYLITDGYADQFGGPKGKKFKYKPLMEMLIANRLADMSQQKELLNNAFNQWKEGYEQVDDVSLVGVRV